MKHRLLLTILLSFFTSCFLLPEPQLLKYTQQAVFAHDSSAVLILESHYETTKAYEAYWKPVHTHVLTQAYRVPPAQLASSAQWQDLASWDDSEGDILDGRIQTASIYWYKDADSEGRLFYINGDKAVSRMLSSPYTRQEFLLPEAQEKRYFWDYVRDDGQPVPAMSVLPSPNGAYVAVRYVLGVLGEQIWEMNFYKCLAVFTNDGKLLFTYDPYTDDVSHGAATLASIGKINMPLIEPELENSQASDANSQPPFEAKRSVASFNSAYFLWGADSLSLYLAGQILPEGSGEVQPYTYKIVFSEAGLSDVQRSTALPGVSEQGASAAPGGAVGLLAGKHYLLAYTLAENEVHADFFLHELQSWTSYEDQQAQPVRFDKVSFVM